MADALTRAWLRLSLIKGLGGESCRRLLTLLGSPEAILAASVAQLSEIIGARLAAAIAQGGDPQKLERAEQWLDQSGNHLISLADDAYPSILLNIPSPPLLLYAKGRLELLTRPALSVVGSRHATPQGVRDASAFARTFSDSGWCVVSGLAYGIDAAAHQGALLGQGSSIAVVGTGLDRVYPAAHRALAHQLAQQGLLLSEFPLDTPPRAANFPRRNRIISGLSMGCLVVEASLQSGSLITARLAVEQGRDVFAIPGSIHSPQSKGCHALLKQGAKLVECAQDVLEELGASQTFIAPPQNAEQGQHSDLLEQMGYGAITLDELSEQTGLTIAELSAMLLTLELEGLVNTLPGGRYQRLQ